VRHLLTHTSGLPRLEEGFKALRSDGRASLNYTTKQMFDAAAKDKLDFAAGERFPVQRCRLFPASGMIIEKSERTEIPRIPRYAFLSAARHDCDLSPRPGESPEASRPRVHDPRRWSFVNIRRVTQVELPSHYGVFSTVKESRHLGCRAGSPSESSSRHRLRRMWTETRLNDGSTFPYGFGWFVEERRGHRWINHTGITGTEFSRFPDDELTAIVLTNLGRNVGRHQPSEPLGV